MEFQVDAEWEADPYCKKCGRSITLENATHYCCRRCSRELNL